MTLRCALVNMAFGELAGIDSSLKGIAAAVRKLDAPFDIVVLTPGQAREQDGVRFVPYRPWSRARRAQRLFRYRTIASAPLRDYDVLFLRYPTSIDLDPGALFRRQLARRIATVHHTNEVRELMTGPRSPGIAARALLEWGIGRRVLARIDGIVGVTDEIRAYEVSRARSAKPSAVVSNGVDVEGVPLTRYVPFDGKTLRLVVVASAIAPWHGWDRLRDAVRKHRGARVFVDAVGSFGVSAGHVEHHDAAEIRYHGVLRHADLTKVLGNANIGVSSLALHRAGLSQGCVLKTREYAARGLPFVYAYDDVDLQPNDRFCLRLDAGENPVSVEEIFEFASRASKIADLSEEARAAAHERMDWTVKVKAFQSFAERLLN